RAVALTSFATPSGNVEGEMSRRQPALFSLRQRGKQIADGIERLKIGHRIRARRPPNRRLIHQHHFVDEFSPLKALPLSRASPRPSYRLMLGFHQRLIQNLMQ